VSDGRDATPAAEGEDTLSGRREEGSTVTVTRPSAGEGPITVSPSVYRRLMSGLPGYIVAMLACLGVVGVVMLITPRRNPGAMPRVDYRGDLSGLEAIAPYSVYTPEGLTPQWYPTSSRLTGKANGPVAWHLGFYTPQKQYAALEESNEQPSGPGGFVDRMTSQGHPDGSAQVAGATWEKTFRKDKKQRSLVRRLNGLTLVVTGTASYDELAVLASSLKPRPKPSPARS
jgi:hypothetical protein